jgi:hypothetical protein
LLPLADSPLSVDFADPGTGYRQTVAVRLTRADLVGTQAFVSAMPPRWPPPFNRCSIRWRVGDRLLAETEIRGISHLTLDDSLYAVDANYLYQDAKGSIVSSHHLPRFEGVAGFRPSFLVASREPGLAALCALQIRVLYRDPARAALVIDQDVLIADGPSRCLPPTMDFEGLAQLRAFELLNKGKVLAVLPVSPTPAAVFTSEGGFAPTEDYDWTPMMEEELVDRLQKLMLVGPNGRGADVF